VTRSLTSIEAASFLRKHVVTVRQLAGDGKIPGAKVGSDWLFLEDDLIAYIRGQYRKPTKPCPSTSSQALPTGTRTSPSLVSPGFADRLEQRIASKRNASTTNGRRSYGR
jgi:excisionase family DNA binding protein